MNLNLTKYLFGIFLFFVFISCESIVKEGPQTKEITTSSKEEVTDENSENEINFILPSTVQIGQIFRNAGLRYVDGITNSTNNLQNYNTKTSKMLAYGMYSTDLSYCVLNNQSQEALMYLNALEKISNDIGFSDVYKSKDLFDRFEKNLGINDSIIEIMIEIQERTDYFVEDYQMDNEALVVFVGAWVEGMFIGVKATNELNKKAISMRLIEQMSILDNLLLGLEKQKKNKELTSIYKQLKDLKSFFDNIEEVKDLDNSITDLEISFSNLTWIAESISSLRTEMIK